MKGINGVDLFFTFQCEKGKMHEDKVKFDQVNSVAKEGVAYLGRQRNLRGRKITCGRNPNVWGPGQRDIHLHKRRKRQP